MAQRQRPTGSSRPFGRRLTRRLQRFPLILRGRKFPLLICFFALAVVAGVVFAHYYIRFSRMVDARLSGQVFHHASLILSAPATILPGESATPQEIVDRLRRSLYVSGGKSGSGIGTFQLDGNRLRIYPGPASFFASGQDREGAAEVDFDSGRIESITGLNPKAELAQYELEPEIITTLFGPDRSKRLIVTFDDCPKPLVHAVLAAEDRRFFSHYGVNVLRLTQAAVKDILSDRRSQGGSTLTMQLARNFFLTPRRTIKRKLEEIFLAFLIEKRLNKEDIFTLYANQVYMGQSGSFSLYGFGEASEAYFNRDVKDLTLPQAALLAGMIRGPNLYSPYRYPRRALDRRNWVLREMARDGFISASQAEHAQMAALGVKQHSQSGSAAPYFVDMVKDKLLAHFSEKQLLSENYRVYTTLDPQLQAAAVAALRSGMTEVDKRLKARRRKNSPPLAPNEPQAALVVLDPHTGEVRALVGGRSYGASQLNHALALRQPGSSFKPFVYAAALSSGVDGSKPLITTATPLPDSPSSTFQFNNQTYQPKDFENTYYGTATVREALALSLNVATVNLAQMIGYEKIKDLAIAAGLNNGIQATPAIALGSYVATPLQMAGAYTIFANGGVYEAPRLIVSVKDSSGKVLWQDPEVARQVLDPRVAFLMVSLMQTVVDHGTGEGVRARGFLAPAAGKTGTLRDGWFAGFTSNLLAVSWVGYDNNANLGLTGASSALPLWTAFMKSAQRLPAYQNMQPFTQPLGVIVARIDPKTQTITANNPLAVGQDIFIDGTQPVSSGFTSALANLIRRILPVGNKSTSAGAHAPAPAMLSPTPANPGNPDVQSPSSETPSGNLAKAKPAPAPQKKSIVKRFFSIFKHKKTSTDSPSGP